MHKELGLVGEKNKKGKKVMKLYLKKSHHNIREFNQKKNSWIWFKYFFQLVNNNIS